MSQRSEFAAFARAPGATVSEICRRFGISRKTGYKWLSRSRQDFSPLEDLSRRPAGSPWRTPPGIEQHILALRHQFPFYGGRKLRRLLLGEGVERPPAASTVTAILSRNGLLSPQRRRSRNWQRFEAAAPNALWQMDFKGPFPLHRGRCHPLTVLDDHSRFCLCLAACPNEQGVTVKEQLIPVFQRYGLPERMLMDNGGPWGSSGQGLHTAFSAWLIRAGVTVSHGHPLHPQTQGKDERFPRTLKLELVSQRPVWHDNAEVQLGFDRYRVVYNFERPHEALAYEVPASRYAPSPRTYPAKLPPIEYDTGLEVRRVHESGRVKLRGQRYFIGKAFAGEPVGLLQVGEAVWDVYYCHQRIAQIDISCSRDDEDVLPMSPNTCNPCLSPYNPPAHGLRPRYPCFSSGGGPPHDPLLRLFGGSQRQILSQVRAEGCGIQVVQPGARSL
jgi:transposase InsO family protein